MIFLTVVPVVILKVPSRCHQNFLGWMGIVLDNHATREDMQCQTQHQGHAGAVIVDGDHPCAARPVPMSCRRELVFTDLAQ
jgi:hypothetical protein